MYQPTDLKKAPSARLMASHIESSVCAKVMGRGGSIVNVKLKNLIDGSVIPKTFKGQDKIETAEVHNKAVQYLYNDGETFFFMDPRASSNSSYRVTLSMKRRVISKKVMNSVSSFW